MTDPAARTALAVALLARDQDLQRLVVTWPQLERGLADTALVIAWARISGVPTSVVKRRAPVLIQNGLCLPGGLVAEEAMKVCQAFAAATLRDAGRTRR